MIVVSTGNDAEKNNLNVTQKGDEDFNKHDVAAVNDSWADDGVESDVAAPEDVVGKAKIAEGTTMFMSAFPDAKITRLSLWAAGDYVIGVSSFTGTNDGPLGPMPKTGKAMKLTIAEVAKLDGGKVKQLWRFWDSGSMAIQLGLVPPPGEGGPAAPPAR
jgi:predicted ester cyclase